MSGNRVIEITNESRAFLRLELNQKRLSKRHKINGSTLHNFNFYSNSDLIPGELYALPKLF